MDSAPGYDPLMPHDILHTVAEVELGLDEISRLWSQLELGEAVAVSWPDLSVSRWNAAS